MGRFNANEWAQQTHFHGVSDLFGAKSFVQRLFWALILIGSFGVTGWQLWNLIKDYAEPPHYTTSIYAETQPHSRFPNVTFCNFQRAHMGRARELNVTAEVLSHLWAAAFQSYDFGPGILALDTSPEGNKARTDWWHIITTPESQAWEAYYARSVGEGQDVDVRELYERLAFSCEETFVMCSFAGRIFSCCAGVTRVSPSFLHYMFFDRLVLVEVINQHGVCYTVLPTNAALDSAGAVIQSRPGAENGLRVMLNSNVDLSLPVTTHNFLDAGYRVFVDFEPFLPQPQTEIAMRPGTHAWIRFRNQLTFHRRPNYLIFPMECTEQKLKLLKGEYTRTACELECAFELIHSECGCVVMAETRAAHPLCNATRHLHCVLPAFGKPKEAGDWTECMRNCREPCAARITSMTTASYSAFPSPHLALPIYKELMKYTGPPPSENASEPSAPLNLTEGANWMSNLMNVNVYSETNNYLVAEKKEEMSIFNFVGTFGGVFGLWMGASLLTLVQLVFYAANSCLWQASSCSQPAKVQDAAPTKPIEPPGWAGQVPAKKTSYTTNLYRSESLTGNYVPPHIRTTD